jgi:hypothetical protein
VMLSQGILAVAPWARMASSPGADVDPAKTCGPCMPPHLCIIAPGLAMT